MESTYYLSCIITHKASKNLEEKASNPSSTSYILDVLTQFERSQADFPRYMCVDR